MPRRRAAQDTDLDPFVEQHQVDGDLLARVESSSSALRNAWCWIVTWPTAIIAGSYGARPAAPSRYAASNRSRSICSTAPKIVHTKWFSGSQSVNDGGINNN